MDTNEFFVADKELVDSLKLESSSLSPFMERNLKDITGTIARTAIGLFGHYMPDETKTKLYSLPERVVITSYRDFTTLYQTWDGSDQDLNALGVTSLLGNIILMPHPYELATHAWEGLTEEGRLELMKNGMSQQKVVDRIADFQFTRILFHEIMHIAHNPLLSTLFVEFAVPYYYRFVVDEFGLGRDFRSELEFNLALCYEKFSDFMALQNKNVHTIFFGLMTQEHEITEMMNGFSSFVYSFFDIKHQE